MVSEKPLKKKQKKISIINLFTNLVLFIFVIILGFKIYNNFDSYKANLINMTGDFHSFINAFRGMTGNLTSLISTYVMEKIPKYHNIILAGLSFVIPLIVIYVVLGLAVYGTKKIGFRPVAVVLLAYIIGFQGTTGVNNYYRPVFGVSGKDIITGSDNFNPDEPSVTMTQLLLAGPYFYSSTDMPGTKNEMFDGYMKTLTADSSQAAEEIIKNYDSISNEIDKIFKLVSEIKNKGNAGVEVAKQVKLFEELYGLGETERISYENTIIRNYGHPAVNASSIDKKISHAIKSANYINESFMQLAGIAAVLANKNPQLSESSELKRIFDDTGAFEKLNENNIYIHIINELVNYIEIAKMEVAVETLVYASNTAQYTKNQVDKLKQVDNLSVTPEFIEAVESYMNSSALIAASSKLYLEERLKATNYNEAMITRNIYERDSVFLESYADEDSVIGRTIDIGSTLSDAAAPPSGGYFNSLYNNISSMANDAVNIANFARESFGNGLEVINGVAGVGSNILYGLYNGNSPEDIAQSVSEVMDRTVENISSGKGGNEVLSTATSYLDGAAGLVGTGYENIGTVIESSISDTFNMGRELLTGETQDYTEVPSNYLSSCMGWLGKTAGSTFTSLGSGASKIANTGSDNGDIAQGMFEVGTAFIGGSQNIGKLSGLGKDTTKGILDGIKEFAGKNFDEGAKIFDKAAREYADDFTRGIKDTFEKNTMKDIFKGEFSFMNILDHITNTGLDNEIANVINDAADSIYEEEVAVNDTGVSDNSPDNNSNVNNSQGNGNDSGSVTEQSNDEGNNEKNDESSGNNEQDKEEDKSENVNNNRQHTAGNEEKREENAANTEYAGSNVQNNREVNYNQERTAERADKYEADIPAPTIDIALKTDENPDDSKVVKTSGGGRVVYIYYKDGYLKKMTEYDSKGYVIEAKDYSPTSDSSGDTRFLIKNEKFTGNNEITESTIYSPQNGSVINRIIYEKGLRKKYNNYAEGREINYIIDAENRKSIIDNWLEYNSDYYIEIFDDVSNGIYKEYALNENGEYVLAQHTIYDSGADESKVTPTKYKSTCEQKVYEVKTGYLRYHAFYVDAHLDGKECSYTSRVINDTLVSYPIKITYYKGGKSHGEHKSYYIVNGQLQQSIDYVEGKREGKFVEYYENGYLKTQGEMADNIPINEWISYGDNGKVSNISTYSNNGQLEGDYKEFYNTGAIRIQGQYAGGERVGEWTYYTNEGEISNKRSY